jgi:serine/threonine-protein kinase
MALDPDDPIPSRNVDAGLRVAFGAGAAPADSSVVRALTAKLGRRPSVYLEAVDPEDTPVKTTPESRALLDPTGRYRVLGEISRGGMGVVYRGHDTDLGRDVAVKVLRDKYLDNAEALERFVEEAQIGGQLQHPGIVPVYGLGMEQGERPYFAMKLVRGETLSTMLGQREGVAGDRRRVLGIFEQICQTVSYAHSRRVVHRDLKPANVMLGAFGEVQVVDWGFAKVLAPGPATGDAIPGEPDGPQTVIATVRSDPNKGMKSTTGSVFGTPAYMPPEQATGEVQRMDERSDVFSLGAILCEILTGDPPYRSVDGNVMTQAASGAVEGAHDRLRASGADPELTSLAIQCLAPTRKGRPADAGAVADRVGDYLTSVEERARQAEVREARARYRTRTIGLLAAMAFFVLFSGVGFYLWSSGEADRRRTTAARRVAGAMTEASELLGQAHSGMDGDTSPWERAVGAAEVAHEFAADEDVDEAQRGGARALLQRARDERAAALVEVERRVRDSAMRERLITLRIPVDEDLRSDGSPEREARRLDRAYATAFHEYLGIESFSARSTDELASALQAGRIQPELSAALDHWALVRDGIPSTEQVQEAPATTALRHLARSLDEPGAHEWLQRLRALLPAAPDKRAALELLADEVELEELPATRLVLLGEALWSSGARTRAVSVYERAQELHPADFGVCLRLALLLQLVGKPRWELSEETLRIAHALRPDIREVQHRRAIALGKLGRLAENLRIIADLQRLEPTNAHWVYHSALTQDLLGDHEASLESFRRALEMEPGDVHVLIRYGRKLEELGRTEEALEVISRATDLKPEAPGPLNDLALVLRACGRLDEAEETIRRTLELHGDAPRLLTTSGLILWDQGRLELATDHFRRGLQIEQGNTILLANLGGVLFERGRVDEALAEYRKLLELNANGPGELDLAPVAGSLFGNGQKFSDAGRTLEAMACLRLAVEVAPDYVPAWTQIGIVQAGQGRYEAAAETFKHVLELDPTFVMGHANLATAHLNLGLFDQAESGYREALRLDPQYLDALGGLAGLDAARGDPDSAIEGYRHVVEIDPDHPEANLMLGRALLETGQIDEGIRALMRGLELNPHHLEARNALGFHLHEQERFDEAIEWLREGVEIAPTYAEFHGNLGRSLQAQGQDEEARVRYVRALELFAGRRDPNAAEFAALVQQLLEEVEKSLAANEEAEEVEGGR